MKKISSIFIFIIGILFSAAIFTFLLVLFIKNYHVSKEIYKSGDILNVGILQTLLAIITLGIGSVAFLIFWVWKKSLKDLKKY